MWKMKSQTFKRRLQSGYFRFTRWYNGLHESLDDENKVRTIIKHLKDGYLDMFDTKKYSNRKIIQSMPLYFSKTLKYNTLSSRNTVHFLVRNRTIFGPRISQFTTPILPENGCDWSISVSWGDIL